MEDLSVDSLKKYYYGRDKLDGFFQSSRKNQNLPQKLDDLKVLMRLVKNLKEWEASNYRMWPTVSALLVAVAALAISFGGGCRFEVEESTNAIVNANVFCIPGTTLSWDLLVLLILVLVVICGGVIISLSTSKTIRALENLETAIFREILNTENKINLDRKAAKTSKRKTIFLGWRRESYFTG